MWQGAILREALQCLAAAAAHRDAKALMVEEGAARAALRVVEADCDGGGGATLLAHEMLTSLSVGDGVEAALVAQGVAEALAEVLTTHACLPADERSCALNTLTNLCASDEATRGRLVARGVAEALLGVVEAAAAGQGDELMRTQAALGLMNLSACAALPGHVAARDAERPADGHGPLLDRAVRALLAARARAAPHRA